MKFIKASERLPSAINSERKIVCRWIFKDGDVQMRVATAYEFLDLMNKTWASTEHAEWLDETEDWISVEFPPTENGYYLVIDPNSFQKKHAEIMRYSTYNRSWYDGGDVYHPTHWQPLPALPSPPTKQP